MTTETNDAPITRNAITRSGGTPDLRTYYAVHQAMRTSNEWLVSGIARATPGDRRRPAAIRRWFTGYAGELRNHHHNEDDIFFPALVERVPAYATYDQGLADDHLRLDAVIDGIEVALRLWAEQPASTDARMQALELANELHDLLAAHLDLEDSDVLPMLEQHFTAEEYAVLDARVIEDLTIRQALFTVPWFMTTVDPDTAARTLADAPGALRALFRVTRRRYTRLAKRAFA